MPQISGPFDGRKARKKRCDRCVERRIKVWLMHCASYFHTRRLTNPLSVLADVPVLIVAEPIMYATHPQDGDLLLGSSFTQPRHTIWTTSTSRRRGLSLPYLGKSLLWRVKHT